MTPTMKNLMLKKELPELKPSPGKVETNNKGYNQQTYSVLNLYIVGLIDLNAISMANYLEYG